MPHIVADHQVASLEVSPYSPAVALEVGPGGMIAFAADEADRYTVSLIDSAGFARRRIGLLGSGPTETRRAKVLGFNDSTLMVADLASPRITLFALDGAVRRSVSLAETVNYGQLADSNTLLALSTRRGPPHPVLLSTTTGDVRPLLDRPDSFFRLAFTGLAGPGLQRRPVLGLWPGGFAVADEWRYQLGFYGWDGVLQNIVTRDIPRINPTAARVDTELRRRSPAVRAGRGGAADSLRQRDEVGARAQPFFPYTSHLGLDAQGRVWVFGIEGDSGFADVFTHHHFLGRIPLPCRAFEASASVWHSWLALNCGPEESAAEAGAVVKIYRIVDDTPR